MEGAGDQSYVMTQTFPPIKRRVSLTQGSSVFTVQGRWPIRGYDTDFPPIRRRVSLTQGSSVDWAGDQSEVMTQIFLQSGAVYH